MDAGERTPDSDEQFPRRRGPIVGISVAAIVVVNLPLYLPLLPDFGDWLYPGRFLSVGLMAIVPFLLARIAPRAAGFDVQWFSRKWSQWGWFFGMVVLLFVCGAISKPLANVVPLKYTPPLLRPGYTADYTFTGVILHGIILVLLCPIAEEIFWRGYLLEQLRKLTYSGVALLIQSLLFSFAHLPFIIPRIGGFQASISFFLFGLVLGMWRIRLRSLLPLILAHVILNGVVSIHILKTQYDFADLVAKVGIAPDFAAKIRSSPKCQQIYLLTREPVQKALPAIIAFLGDPDDGVRAYATDILIHHYRDDAEPYLKKALASSDRKLLDGALFAVELGRWSGLKQEVRNVVWSVDDLHVQLSAMITMWQLGDADGLRDIAQKHLKEKVRESAKRHLHWMEEKK